jgi:hypothetical protein
MGLLIDYRIQKSLGCTLRLPCLNNEERKGAKFVIKLMFNQYNLLTIE